jgi:Protein of unknown function (DUF1501)
MKYGRTAMPFDASFTRRDFHQLLAGLGLSFAMPALSSRAAERRGKERAKSLITLWMAGGPSQLETWDPHPGTTIGGDVGAISTTIKGLRIADLYPRMAEQIHHLSVIRSLASKEGDHERGTYFVKTGYRPDPTLKHPALGAIFAHETEKLDQGKIEIPRHVSLLPGQWPARGGFLGPHLDAFKIGNPGMDVGNMKAPVADKRQDRRLNDLRVLSDTFARGRFSRVRRTQHDKTIDRALTMMQSKQLKAFLIDDEPKAVRDAYGDTKFGRGCLVARRLVETGVRAIEVTLRGFDTHTKNYEGHKTQAAILDPAFAALIADLKKRNLLDSTIVLCIGEFGRTPKINALAGRDHWPHAFSCVVGGGGLKAGVVIGETDPSGDKKEPKNAIKLPDLYATILQRLGVDYAKEYHTPVGRPMTAVNAGSPIKRLL